MLFFTASESHRVGKAPATGVKADLLRRQPGMGWEPAARSHPQDIIACAMANLGEPAGSPER